ncbi:MAG: FAD-binding protein [Candidatus Cloacimonadota bacterium]|nr:MAG: FAD-binding protein [Candidatus Cloacimonadota bacterium]
MQRIGVFICHCGINISSTVDVEDVIHYVRQLPGVVTAEDYTYMCSDPGQELIREHIKKFNLNKVIVASCSPAMHEVTFREVVKSAGLNPFCFEMANIREQCSWVHLDKNRATDKAKAILSAAVSRVGLLEPLEEKTVSVTPSVLIIGAGIAGIQASLDIANAGYKVYLVEKEPSIGGRMSQLDKTFPTLDCSACILTPKMSEVGRHPNIELLTYTEVADIEGFVGNFKVKVKRKPTYVDWDKCNGCDDCTSSCPVDLPDEFNAGLGTRKAIYRLFPQAVPNKFLIDKRGKPPCTAACPAGVNVQGYIALIKIGKFKEALELERRDNPFPSVCGRVCTHPCEIECRRAEFDEPISIASLKRFIADYEKEPERPRNVEKRMERIAIVGSGPSGLSCGYFLALKGYNVTVFEAMEEPGGMLRYGIPRFRLPLDALMRDIKYIEDSGVEIKTKSPIADISKLQKDGFDSVYVAIGAHQEIFTGIEGENLEGVLSCIEFLRKVNSNEEVEIGKRVAVIGGGNAALDAARTSKRLGADVTILYRRTRYEMPADAKEIDAAIEEGIKIEFLSQPVKFNGKDRKVSGIELIRMKLGELDASGRRRPVPIPGSEFLQEVDNVILAIGQSPDSDWLRKYLNITKWGTIEVDGISLNTGKTGILAGGDAVRGPSTIVEAISDGKKAALAIDAYINKKELIVEKKAIAVDFPEPLSDEKKERCLMDTIPLDERIKSFREVETGFDEKKALEEAKRCLNCGGCSACEECMKSCDREAINYELADEVEELECGAIIVATGFDPFDARIKKEYAYNEYNNVITGLELERLLSASGPTTGEIIIDGKTPKQIVFIHCVGSRDESVGNEYCSRVCCMFIAKQAHLVKDKVPEVEVTVLYMDMRAFGKGYEEFYDRVRMEGVLYRRCNPSEIYRRGEKLIVKVEDTLLGELVDIEADVVVLGTGIVPRKETEEIRKILKLSKSQDGFLLEAHPKLRPVDTALDGVFLAGCCQAPKDIPDTVAQAKGASSSAMSMLTRGFVNIEPVVSTLDEVACSGCGTCEVSCEYGALTLDTVKKIMVVNEVLCKGCGACASACPSNAIILKHYTPKQLLSQIEAILY